MRKVIVFTLVVCLVLNAAGSWGFEKPSSISLKFKDETTVNAEITGDKATGLMYRYGLGENEGMFFAFGAEGKYGFWMKNMKFPIDIIWLDENFKVVHLVENAQPCSNECPTYTSELPAKYVLEVGAHFTSKHLLTVGDQALTAESGIYL